MARERSVRLALAHILATVSAARAQTSDIEIDWFTVESGATSTGKLGIEVTGTTGQPSASTLQSGGEVELVGGFWAVLLNEPVSWVWQPDEAFASFNVEENWKGLADGIPIDLDEVVLGPTAFFSYTVQVHEHAAIGRLRLLQGAGTVFLHTFGTELTLQGSELTGEPSLVVGGDARDCETVVLILENVTVPSLPSGLTAQAVAVGDCCPGLGRLDVFDGLNDTTTPTRFRNTGAFWIGRAGKGEFRVTRALAETTGEVTIGTAMCPQLSIPDGHVLLDEGAMWSVGLAGGPADFTVGDAGSAVIRITDCSTLESHTSGITLAKQAGSSAEVVIGDGDFGNGLCLPGESLSRWHEMAGEMRIGLGGTAVVSLAADGVLEAPTIILGPDGELNGEGTIIGTVRNSGQVLPGVYGAGPVVGGVLDVNGDYYQDQVPAGSLVVRIAQSAAAGALMHDRIMIAGNASLGGGLFLDVQEGADPQPTDQFPVLTALSGTLDSFDVAAYPALANSILRVCYPGGDSCSAALGDTVTIEVQGLDEFFNFDGVAGGDVASPADAVLGPIDDDAFPDLIVAVPGSDQVVVLLNAGVDGNGDWMGFEGGVAVGVGPNTAPMAVAAGYFDEDALLDIAVANSGSGTVSILTNTGLSPWLALHDSVVVGSQPEVIGAGDFDGTVDPGEIPQPDPREPGVMDLAVGNAGDGTISLLRNTGDGTFETLGLIILPGSGGGGFAVPTAVLPIDVGSRDKNLDLIVTSALELVATGGPERVGTSGQGELLIYENLGGGAFEPPVQMPIGAGPDDIAAEDLNQDGRADLVTANAGDGTVSVIVATEFGGFAPAVNLELEAGTPSGLAARSLVVVNVDGDQDLDIVVAATGASSPMSLQLLRNDMNGNEQLIFAGVAGADLPVQAPNPSIVLSGDLDDDLDADLVALSGNAAGIAGPGLPVPIGAVVNRLCDCEGDVDCNGHVNVSDLVEVIVKWGSADPEADLDNNGIVAVGDLVLVITNWGPC